MVKSRPFVILSAATSLDGKIATKSGESNLSSRKDKVRLHKLRSSVDAILVGKNTVKRDNPLLTSRLVKGKNPIRIILDSKGQLSSNSRIVKTSKQIQTIVVCSQQVSSQNINRLKKHNIDVIISGKTKINLKLLLAKLAKQNIKSILLEGGGKVNWDFLKNNLVDEVIITVAPYLVGGKDATTLVEGKGFSTISKSVKLKLKNITRLNNEIVLHYTKL